MRIDSKIWMAACVAVSIAAAIPAAIPALARRSFAPPQAAGAEQVTVVNSNSGPCTADFTVSDVSGKGLYNAKINIQIRYRFGGFHRIDATVGTNADGKARMEGLPEQIKRPTEFTISYGGQSKSVTFDPVASCHSQNKIVFDGK